MTHFNRHTWLIVTTWIALLILAKDGVWRHLFKAWVCLCNWGVGQPSLAPLTWLRWPLLPRISLFSWPFPFVSPSSFNLSLPFPISLPPVPPWLLQTLYKLVGHRSVSHLCLPASFPPTFDKKSFMFIESNDKKVGLLLCRPFLYHFFPLKIYLFLNSIRLWRIVSHFNN